MKLKKMHYMTMKGIKKINCYYVNIPKQLIKEAKLDDTKEMEVIAKNKEIIIREK